MDSLYSVNLRRSSCDKDQAQKLNLYAYMRLLYIRRIGSFLGIEVDEPVTVHQDNTSAITMEYCSFYAIYIIILFLLYMLHTKNYT
jgi:hypothetical protein